MTTAFPATTARANGAANQARPSRMTLGAVTRGRVEKPIRVLVYGTEGIGKSTFGADAPSPIFLASEDGTAHLDVARFPEPQSWSDALDAVRVLATEPHDYRTLVIDTLDWLEPLCWAHVCAVAKKPDIEAFGFGKGYVAALDEWRLLLSRLDALRERTGMHVVLLAHSVVRTFKNPDADVGDFDRYELKLNAKAGGLLKEWADAVLFAQHETCSREVNGKTRGVSTGARLVHTERRAAFDAKNRYGLPESFPLSWADFAEGVAAHKPADAKLLRAEIEAYVAQLDEADRAKSLAWLASPSASDPNNLAKFADRLRGKLATSQPAASPATTNVTTNTKES